MSVLRLEVVDLPLVVCVPLPHVSDVLRGLLEDLRPAALVALHRGDGVPQAGEALLDVVAALPLKSVVVSALVKVSGPI